MNIQQFFDYDMGIDETNNINEDNYDWASTFRSNDYDNKNDV